MAAPRDASKSDGRFHAREALGSEHGRSTDARANQHARSVTPAKHDRRTLHVYDARLVQDVRGREVELWNPGPVVAWDEGDAFAQAYFNAVRCAEPIAVDPAGSKPRLLVRRVVARVA